MEVLLRTLISFGHQMIMVHLHEVTPIGPMVTLYRASATSRKHALEAGRFHHPHLRQYQRRRPQASLLRPQVFLREVASRGSLGTAAQQGVLKRTCTHILAR